MALCSPCHNARVGWRLRLRRLLVLCSVLPIVSIDLLLGGLDLLLDLLGCVLGRRSRLRSLASRQHPSQRPPRSPRRLSPPPAGTRLLRPPLRPPPEPPPALAGSRHPLCARSKLQTC